MTPELSATTEWLPPESMLGALGLEIERLKAKQRRLDFADSMGLSKEDLDDAASAAVGPW